MKSFMMLSGERLLRGRAGAALSVKSIGVTITHSMQSGTGFFKI